MKPVCVSIQRTRDWGAMVRQAESKLGARLPYKFRATVTVVDPTPAGEEVSLKKSGDNFTVISAAPTESGRGDRILLDLGVFYQLTPTTQPTVEHKGPVTLIAWKTTDIKVILKGEHCAELLAVVGVGGQVLVSTTTEMGNCTEMVKYLGQGRYNVNGVVYPLPPSEVEADQEGLPDGLV